jgi:hypothetical protein
MESCGCRFLQFHEEIKEIFPLVVMFILCSFNEARSPFSYEASNNMMISKHVEGNGRRMILGDISAFSERTEENHINPQSE